MVTKFVMVPSSASSLMMSDVLEGCRTKSSSFSMSHTLTSPFVYLQQHFKEQQNLTSTPLTQEIKLTKVH